MKKEDEEIAVNLCGFLFYIAKAERRPLSEIVLQFMTESELCRKHVDGFYDLRNARPHRAER